MAQLIALGLPWLQDLALQVRVRAGPGAHHRAELAEGDHAREGGGPETRLCGARSCPMGPPARAASTCPSRWALGPGLRSGLSVAVLCGLWYASRACVLLCGLSCHCWLLCKFGFRAGSMPTSSCHTAALQAQSWTRGVPAAVPQLAVKARQGMAQALLAPAGLPIITDD